MTANVHLLVLVLGCEAAAGIFNQIFEERSQVSLRCPHSGGGDVTWSRERNGVRAYILTYNGDRDIKHIEDPGRRYGSLADKSLFIISAVVSDSGRYFCNDEAVDLIPSGTPGHRAPERTSVTLMCPHDVGPSHVPTWTRDSGGLQQGPEAQTLTIRDVQPGDAGLYYCDGKPAVYLDVTRGDKAPPTTTTTTAALPPTEATTVPSTPPRTDKHTTTKKQRPNRKKGDKPRKNSTTTTTTTTTPTTTTTTTTTIPTTTTTTTEYPPPHIWAIGVVVSFLLLLLIFLLIVYLARRQCKRRGSDEKSPVYEEIQDGVFFQPKNGGGTSTAQGAAHCMADLSDGSNRHDHTYDTVPHLPPEKKNAGTSLPNESPYSLIGNPYKDSSQVAVGAYCLLEKPKVTPND